MPGSPKEVWLSDRRGPLDYEALLGSVHGCAEELPASASDGRRDTSTLGTEGIVLVVDDDPDVLEIVAEMVARLGFQVQLASRGSEALEWARAHEGPIAAAVLDVTMPELSGEEIARELHRIWPTTSIVLMSGYQEQCGSSRPLSDLAFGHLKKPFDREDLAHALRDRVVAR